MYNVAKQKKKSYPGINTTVNAISVNKCCISFSLSQINTTLHEIEPSTVYCNHLCKPLQSYVPHLEQSSTTQRIFKNIDFFTI